MLDWLIVGGGIHGTYLSRVLVEEGGVDRGRVRVLDPWAEPLHRWRECTQAVGMDYLRSSAVHHLAQEPFALNKLARDRRYRDVARFRGRYRRPSLAFFNASCEKEISDFGLADLRIRGWARSLARKGGGWSIETDEGEIAARRIVLAIGSGEQQAWPAWTRELRQARGRVHHVFESGFSREGLGSWDSAVVIGGGISALQVATALAEERPGGVTLLRRQSTRKEDFDSDPCWIGPKCLARFWRLKDPGERRQRIDRARYRGSAPSDVLSAFRRAESAGRLSALLGEVDSASFKDGRIRLELKESGGPLEADRIVLATGFSGLRPGGPWLDRAVEDHGLACASCGFPIIDRTLCWQQGLYVSGPLAELEIGPVARNIQGARLAGRRLLEVA